MVKVLKDLWILTSTGVVVFSKVTDERINPQLFGALMSALNSFAEKLAEGGINNFELSNLKFMVFKRRDFLFVGSSLSKVKEKKVLEELKSISDKFFEKYPPEFLSKWDNDVNAFEEFNKYIEDSFDKTPIDKLKEAFW
ncbi:MAG: hypothetical protein ACTSW3_06545 [Promethearchaeota archaeon]